MWRGIFVHRFLEYAVTRGRQAALEYIRSKNMRGLAPWCEKIDTDALPRGEMEVGFAYAALEGTSRRLKRSPRPDADPTAEQCTRVDHLAERDGMPWIIDYKSYDVSDLDPSTSDQLLGGALAVRGQWQDAWGISPNGQERPRGYFVSYVGLLGDGRAQWRTSQLSDAHLDRFAQRSRQVQLRVLDSRWRYDNGQQLTFQVGPCCDRCSVAPLCPARAAQLEAGAGDASRDGAGE